MPPVSCPDGFHLLGLPQLLLQRTALGDVAGADHHAPRRTGIIENRRCDRFDDAAALHPLVPIGHAATQAGRQVGVQFGGGYAGKSSLVV